MSAHSRKLAGIKVLQQKVRRLTAQNEGLKNELSRVKVEFQKLENELAQYSDQPFELFKKSSYYSHEQKVFALKLHSAGNKAYELLREKGFNLPDTRTIRRWLENVEGGPGISQQALKHLKRKKEDDVLNYSNCVLFIDAMHIRKGVSYDQFTQSIIGYTDYGNGQDETTLATEALVVMASSLRAYWKIPVAYLLTAGMNADDQASYLTDVIRSLYEISGIVVRLVTMDSLSTNISMCNKLGCNLSLRNTKTYFKHPKCDTKVFILFDAVHVVKLIRNSWHDTRDIISQSGVVKWEFIEKLNTQQQLSGLNIANKISDRHIYYDNHKMKFRYAVQVLSRSTSIALKVMASYDTPGFEGTTTTATCEFLEIVDKWFDMMNTRSPIGVGKEAPLSMSNWQAMSELLSRTTEYIRTLKVNDVLITQTSKKAAFKAIIFNNTTMKEFTPDLLKEQRYMLTYRLSQDNLELLFCKIRRQGGWMNNPDAKHLSAIFRNMWGQAIMAHPESHEVEDEDLEAAEAVEEEDLLDGENTQLDLDLACNIDHDYGVPLLAPWIESVLGYIAGKVVKTVLKKVDCDVCKGSLIYESRQEQLPSYLRLTVLKDFNHNLVRASVKTYEFIRIAEICLRRSVVPEQISSRQLQSASRLISTSTEHIFTCTKDSSHADHLLSLLISSFFSIRASYMAKRVGTDVSNIRGLYNRHTILAGQ